MPSETVIESFCERCGTRYTFEPPRRRARRLVDIGRTLGLVAEDGTQDSASFLATIDPFHGTFHFCLECRQYTCPNCWNEEAGFCQGCVPLPEGADMGAAEAAATMEATTSVDEAMAELRALGAVEAWPGADLTAPDADGELDAWPPIDGQDGDLDLAAYQGAAQDVTWLDDQEADLEWSAVTAAADLGPADMVESDDIASTDADTTRPNAGLDTWPQPVDEADAVAAIEFEPPTPEPAPEATATNAVAEHGDFTWLEPEPAADDAAAVEAAFVALAADEAGPTLDDATQVLATADPQALEPPVAELDLAEPAETDVTPAEAVAAAALAAVVADGIASRDEPVAEVEAAPVAEVEWPVEPELVSAVDAELIDVPEALLGAEAEPTLEAEAELEAEPVFGAVAGSEPVAEATVEAALEPVAALEPEVAPLAEAEPIGVVEAHVVAEVEVPVAEVEIPVAGFALAAATAAALDADAAPEAEPSTAVDEQDVPDTEAEAAWSRLLADAGEPVEEAAPDIDAHDWTTLAPALGPDVAPAPVLPEPLTAPLAPPAPAPMAPPPSVIQPSLPPAVSPSATAGWQLTAPDVAPTQPGWPPYGPVYRAPDAPPPAPTQPHPAMLRNGQPPAAAAAMGNGVSVSRGAPAGVRPCSRCELPLSSKARFCRRCGQSQA